MRLATLILGLILMGIVGCQSLIGYVGASALGRETFQQAGALGLFIALLFLVGAAFAMGKPIVSVVSFALAAFLGLVGGATTPFKDLTVWGVVSLILAGTSFLGHRELKSVQRKASGE